MKADTPAQTFKEARALQTKDPRLQRLAQLQQQQIRQQTLQIQQLLESEPPGEMISGEGKKKKKNKRKNRKPQDSNPQPTIEIDSE